MKKKSLDTGYILPVNSHGWLMSCSLATLGLDSNAIDIVCSLFDIIGLDSSAVVYCLYFHL